MRRFMTTIIITACMFIGMMANAQEKIKSIEDARDGVVSICKRAGVKTLRYIHSNDEVGMFGDSDGITEKEIEDLLSFMDENIPDGSTIELLEGSSDVDGILDAIMMGETVYMVVRNGSTRITFLADDTDGLVEIKGI